MKTSTKLQQLFHTHKGKHERLLCIFAHPDDESLHCGGILAAAKKKALATSVICVTDGSRGHVSDHLTDQELIRLRAKELKRAARILGVQTLTQWHYADGTVYRHRRKIYRQLQQLISRLKPTILITHDPSGATGHPDHITLSALITKIVQTEKTPTFRAFYAVLPIFDRALQIMKFPFPLPIRNMPNTTHTVNIQPFLTTKKHALQAHATQHLLSEAVLPIPLKTFLQPAEHFHQINQRRHYRFSLYAFQTVGLNFKPKTTLVDISKLPV